jgi:peptidoglycan/xylan/chitin deacetylase (PgdA/CDA1 family)
MTSSPPQSSSFIISLDFELYWGVRDKISLNTYRASMAGERDVIPRMLDLFARHGIHATWATVGFLFFDDKDELLAHLPPLKPRYVNKSLSPYDHILRIGPNERRDPFHYALSLVRQIAQYPSQEIGTHTFSHYYCLAEGQTVDEFRADLDAAHAAARRLGFEMKSLVFPRNQWRKDYLAACAESGIGVFRGNGGAWMYHAQASGPARILKRACRLTDSYLNITGYRSRSPLRGPGGMIDVPPSHFLRPFSRRLAPLDPLYRCRIRAGMKHAATNGLIFHLWWHPHNFARNQTENLKNLADILSYFRELADEHGMASRSMGELIPEAATRSVNLAARKRAAGMVAHRDLDLSGGGWPTDVAVP